MRLVKNFLFLSGGEVLSKLLTFVAIAYAARVVGPTGFGYLEFAAAAVLLAGLLVHQGFGLYGSREIAKDPAATEGLVAGIVSTRYALALLGYTGLIVLVALVDRPPVLEQLVLLYGLSLFAMPLGLQWVFQGHEMMSVAAGLQLTRQLVFALAVLILLRDPAQLWPVAIAEVAGVTALATASLLLYRKRFGRHVPWPGKPPRSVLREGAVIGLSRIFWSVRISGSLVVFGLVAAGDDLGFFGAAMRILVGLYVFVWLYFINLLPSLSRAWKQGSDSLRGHVDASMHAVGWLSLGAGTLWVLLAPLAIRLVYGDAFLPAIPPLQIMAAVCVAAAIHGHYRFALLAAGRQRDEMITSACGTMVALPLIPVGYSTWGVAGAAVALVIGELVIWATSWWYARKALGLGGLGRYLIGPAVTSALLLAASGRMEARGLSGTWGVPVATLGLILAALLFDPRARRRINGLRRGRGLEPETGP